MSNTHTLADVKAKYGEKVIETATSFVVNAYGKYQPNVSFVLAKDFSGDPLKYRSDAPARELIAGLGLGFGASEEDAKVLFGDFWLSKAGKPHFRPKSPQTATHVIVRAGWGGGAGRSGTRGRWDAPEGALYFRRASSNGGGTGYDYYVLPVGFYLVVRDEELDGDAVVTPDFVARAQQVRAMFAQADAEARAKAQAQADAKAAAEEASRLARDVFLPRLEALQPKLERLLEAYPRTVNYQPLRLGETFFSEGWYYQPLLYTEENVARFERNVAYWEEQAVEKLRKQMARAEFRPQFEAFVSRVENLGLTLSFGEEKVNWEGGDYYGGYAYTQEGLDAFMADLVEKERITAEATARQAELDSVAATAVLTDFGGLCRRMGVTNQQDWWVIRPDGSYRVDEESSSRYEVCRKAWGAVGIDELALHYHRSDRYDIAHCEVIYRPPTVTRRQMAAVKQLEEELEASENAFGLDKRLSGLIDRRIAAIDEAMANLPDSLRPEGGWNYQALVSVNGVSVGSGESWVNNAKPFDEHCEGREAQVVYAGSAADGELIALAYYKWGYWNVNLRWRETTDGVPVATSVFDEPAPADPFDIDASIEALRRHFNG